MEETHEVTKEVRHQQTPTGDVATEKTRVSSVPASSVGAFKAQNLIYYFLGIVEILLGFRFVLKVMGANPTSTFVDMIYSLSSIFVSPFTGIFSAATTQGVEVRSVFEPAVLIAMIVYSLLAWGIVKLIDVMTAGE